MDQDTYKTSPQLIQGLKDHCDASSWERFYHIYHPLLFRYACSLGLKPTEAEDLIQETVITVSKSIGSFRHQTEGGTFKGWLYTIVKRKFIDLKRYQTRKRQLDHVSLDNTEGSPDRLESDSLVQGQSPDQELWERDWESFVRQRAYNLLKEKFKIEYLQIFDLAINKDWGVAKIAEFMHINRASVYLKLHRMRRILRQEREALLHGKP
ncbi:MAG: RNA polymerase sigma factor [Verrucomicrobia bacterium]|jgi:RNA polymerase sigma factor (sigma-70 family)|nr:RNA polymerase sigma factor [Verrucomicrobiota bacterium]